MKRTKRGNRFYITGILALDKAYSDLATMKQQKQVLLDCGLDREAHVVQQRIEHQHDIIADLKVAVMKQRAELVRHMLLAFAAADIATTAADKLAEAFDAHTVGCDNKGGKALADIIRHQADEWNECVQMIDGDGVSGNERVSMYYSDLAEEVVATVIPQVLTIVDKYMETEKGKRLL